jgi:hypothetical protein
MELRVADLKLYLTDGFSGDRVVVKVNDKVVFDQGGVTTKKVIGLAQTVPTVQVPGDGAKVEISIPEKKLAATFDVNLSGGSHVPITLDGTTFRHSVVKRIGFM